MTEAVKETTITIKTSDLFFKKKIESQESVTSFGRVITYLKESSIGTFKTIVTIFALHKFVIYFFKDNAEALSIVFKAPVYEELIFRGVLQKGIGLLYTSERYIESWFRNKSISEITTPGTMQIERTLRIGITAVVFGLAHALNPHSSLASKAFQVIHSTLGGIEYGALLEETNTLAYSILGHAANNFIAMTAYVGIISSINALALIVIMDIALLYVAYRGIEGAKADVKSLFGLNREEHTLHSLEHFSYV